MPQSNEYMLKQDDAELIYQKKLTAGTNITIDPTTNTISSTGGGGSSVSYSGSLPQGYGDTIGIITIDGTQYPIKIRNLIQGSNINIVQDMSTGNLTISSTAQGTRVEPNPGGTPTDTLDTIGINGTVYEIEGGGSGNVADVYVNGTSVLDENDIAQVFSHQEITEQEYEALPSTKENDNIMYCIKGSRPSTNGNYFTPIIYSTEEREVGVWIDNKPLYEKTIKTTYTKGSSWATITHNISDIENIVDCEAFVVDQGTMYEVPQYRDSSMYFIVGVNSSVIYYINTWLDSGGDISITLRYTKTTDVAGSGQYTTLGVPAHHYDGNEKVIGTWFGETLYEKTMEIVNSTKGSVTIDLTGMNISRIVKKEGIWDRTNNQDTYWMDFGVYINSEIYSYLSDDIGHNRLYMARFARSNETLTKAYITIQYIKTS